jgi:hypothetical protein
VKFLDAIARQEGFYINGTRAARNNNPGNIEAGEFATAHGASGSDGRFAIFPSAEAGFAALKALFELPDYRNLTVAEALKRYAPPDENETNVYILRVCSWVGCLSTDIVGTLLEAA